MSIAGKVTPDVPRDHLVSVQVLRALAAVSVVAAHAFHEVAVHSASSLADLMGRVPLGAGVDVFFVVSGFVMMWTFGGRFGTAGAPASFVGKRLTRILPPWWAYLSLTVVLLLMIPGKFNTATLEPVHAACSYALFPCTNPRGGHAPLLTLGWTLQFEMFFYAAFAVGLTMRRRTGLAVVATVVTAPLVTAWTWSGTPAWFAYYADPVVAEFLVGMAVQLSTVSGRMPGRRALAWVGAGVATCAAGVFGDLPGARVLTMGGLATATFVGMFWAVPRFNAERAARPLARLGEASYSLYLCHVFVIGAVRVAFVKSGFLSGDVTSTVAFVAVSLTLSVAVSLVSFRRIERPMTAALARAVDAVRERRSPTDIQVLPTSTPTAR